MRTMNTRLLVLIAAVAALAACAHSPKPVAEISRGAEMNKHEDGLSFATAVKLEAETQAKGVAAQHAWIEKNLPGSHTAPTPPPPKVNADEEVITFAQELVQHDGKLYSIIHLEMPDGKLRDVYFDITGYFGK